MNIDLSEYKLVMADSIELKKGNFNAYDIEVEDDNTFYIKLDKSNVLTHNCDGYHISSLIINFFHKWFPNIIKMGKLFILNTPLVSVGVTKRKYYYSLAEFHKLSFAVKNVRYLKGLGSNDNKDWEFIFNNMNLSKIIYDKQSDKMLTIAFGTNSNLRKQWLQR